MATVGKALSMVILFFIVRSLIACCDDCGTGADVNQGYYTIDTLTVAALDNSGKNFFVSTAPVKKEAFGLAIYFVYQPFIGYAAPQQSLFTSAYANDYYEPHDTIQSIKIFTLDQLNADHPAASDVTALFKINYGFGGGYIPIERFYDEPMNATFTLDDVLYVFLLTPPETAGTYSFRVELELTNGRTITTTTNEIILE